LGGEQASKAHSLGLWGGATKDKGCASRKQCLRTDADRGVGVGGWEGVGIPHSWFGPAAQGKRSSAGGWTREQTRARSRPQKRDAERVEGRRDPEESRKRIARAAVDFSCPSAPIQGLPRGHRNTADLVEVAGGSTGRACRSHGAVRVDGGQGKRREEQGWMKEDRGAGGRLQPQEGALQVDPMPRDGRSGEVYSPRALVPRQWRVGCTCVHLRKGRGSDRRMMHITVCRPDRDGRDGGGALHARGGGSNSLTFATKTGCPGDAWVVSS